MKNLLELLSFNLPKGRYKLFHIQSQPSQCKHLLIYHKKNVDRPTLTIKIKHFISLINDDDLIFMGIEIYVYLTIFEDHVKHHIFISKADTTGLSLQKYKIGQLINTIVQYLIEYDLRNYFRDVKLKSKDTVTSPGNNPTIASLNRIIDKLKEGTAYYRSIPHYNDVVIPATRTDLKTIVPPDRIQTYLSLFTRASEQYLFHNSSKNKGKHVIGGDDLLNWWIKLINETLQKYVKDGNWNCRLRIPGSDNVSISKKLPVSNNNVNWSIGSIFDKDDENLAINQIPLFPDDPKGRFLEHLIVENRHKSTSLMQFWQELGFRQEFRLGNVVGIIGCERDEVNISSIETTSDICVLTLGQYKKILNVMKNEDFSEAGDVKGLVSVKVPDLMKEFSATNYYVPLEGISDDIPITKTIDTLPRVNDLSLAVKRKSGMARSEPVNDLSKSIKGKPVNDISASVKRKPENTASEPESAHQTVSPRVNIVNGLVKKKPRK